MKRILFVFLGLAGSLTTNSAAQAQNSIWSRRDPYLAHANQDTRARHVGDVLTVQLRVTTLFDGRDGSRYEKSTRLGWRFNYAGSLGAKGRAPGTLYSGNLSLGNESDKEMEGEAETTSERAFIDQLSVQVVDVLPNRNLVISGQREQIVGNEVRVLRLTGVVRPNDIRIDNVVDSRFIGNLSMEYVGDGPAAKHTRFGFLGRMVNRIWPF